MYTPSNDMAVRPGRLTRPHLKTWSQRKERWRESWLESPSRTERVQTGSGNKECCDKHYREDQQQKSNIDGKGMW